MVCTHLGGFHQIRKSLLIGLGLFSSLISMKGGARHEMLGYAAVDVGLELRYHLT
jgi:hypothetical protein